MEIVDEVKPAQPEPKSATRKRVGRPPKSAKAREAVESAVHSMDQVYSILAVASLASGRTLTATAIAEHSEEWLAGDRKAFEASPKLAAAIAGVGQASGVLGFVMTNAMAVMTIVPALRADAAARTSAKKKDRSTVRKPGPESLPDSGDNGSVA